MPKQALHINRFEGGMNTDFAPEDIPNNSLLNALGISVSNIGRIVMPGDTRASSGIATTSGSFTTIFAAGYGLFPFSSDYAQDDVEFATKYLAISQGSNIHIYDGSSWDDHGSVPFGLGAGDTANIVEPSYYAPNGDLRVCDGKFNHTNNYNNNVKWFGYIPNKTIGTGTASAGVGGWNVADASIEGGYPKDSSGFATNAVMMDNGTSVADGIYAFTSVDTGASDWGFHFEYVPAADSGTATAFADSTWQVSTSSEYRFYTSFVYDGIQEGNPTPMTMYPSLKAYTDRTTAVTALTDIRFMDTSPNAGANKIHYCKCNGDGSTTTVYTYSDASTTATNHNLSNGDVVYIDGTTNYEGYHTVVDATSDAQEFTFASSESTGDQTGYVSKVGTNLAIYFSPFIKINGVETENFSFGASAIDVVSGGNQRITGTRLYWSSSEEGHANLWIMFDCDFEKGCRAFGVGKDEPTVTEYIPYGVNSTINALDVDLGDFNVWKHPPRYETYESLNGYSHDSKLDAKWKTAVIANGRAYIGNIKRREKSTFNVKDTALASGKQDWGRQVDSGTADGNTANKLIDADQDFNAGHIRVGDIIENTTDSTTGKVKAIDSASTISIMDDAGSNLDLCPDGNEAYTIHSTSTEPTLGDRILKSPVDRFDTFPEEMAIELFGGDDGDSIVKLETFADRLFVFKKNTLHIINIAKDVEILESSHKGMGLDGGLPCQACLTSTGIAWMNSNGVYHYNGENIEPLTDNKIETFWKGKVSSHIDQSTAQTAFWLSNVLDAPSIGFDTDSSKLIIHKTSSDAGADEEDILIYDMKIKAWTWINEGTDNDIRTNMVNYNGLLVVNEGTSTFKYDDAPHPPSQSALGAGLNLSIYTKPFDFGTPLQRKKIYKVYVTYRCNGTTSVQMQYYINGNTNTTYNFAEGASNPFLADDSIGADPSGGSIVQFDTTAGIWETAILKPATSSDANNVKSFGLYIFNDASVAVDADFEINDITIIYRNKSVK